MAWIGIPNNKTGTRQPTPYLKKLHPHSSLAWALFLTVIAVILSADLVAFLDYPAKNGMHQTTRLVLPLLFWLISLPCWWQYADVHQRTRRGAYRVSKLCGLLLDVLETTLTFSFFLCAAWMMEFSLEYQAPPPPRVLITLFALAVLFWLVTVLFWRFILLGDRTDDSEK